MPPAARLNAFPVFFRVENRMIVIVGGGEEALAKARLLAQSSADLTIVAAVPEEGLAEWAASNSVDILREPYEAAHLAGAALVFAASGEEALDRRVAGDARRAGIPVNAVDRSELCDFFTPALVNRAPLAVAIGTEGAGPVLAQIVRARIEQLLPLSLGRLARLAVSYRGIAERVLPKGAVRRRFWREFFAGAPARAIEAGDEERAARAAADLIRRQGVASGHVALVGAGPGIAAGKRKGCHSKSQAEINALIVSLAREGKRVVRLKSGDPLIFGRAGEEMQALRDAGISHEVVPGVTAAFAAAADFALPLTLRGVASSIVFTTGHDLRGNTLPDWAKLAIGGATVAVYMGRSIAAEVALHLVRAGLSPDTAVAVVENASLGHRAMFHGTLADLPSLQERAELTGPVMTIIGDAVAGADFSRSEPLSAHLPVLSYV
ncbi:MAG: uroporphyrinogen-III C-methyltransferase [Rhizobiales bacterium]|nr:uroporphyrinogen-III C-methyltransferase [Hyphomicrobiales bacterium]